MLRVSLLRHAKASQDPEGGNTPGGDHARGLNARGEHAAGLMGRYIARHDLIPDVIVCSDAARTRATLALATSSWRAQARSTRTPGALILSTLYLADAATILREIVDAGTRHAAGHVMVIGHNPGLHDLALNLIGSTDGAVRDADDTGAGTSEPQARGTAPMAALAEKFPTAALAVIDFNGEHCDYGPRHWPAIGKGHGRLDRFVRPRDLSRKGASSHD